MGILCDLIVSAKDKNKDIGTYSVELEKTDQIISKQ